MALIESVFDAHDFESDPMIRFEVLGFPDNSHAALAENAENSVPSDALSRRGTTLSGGRFFCRRHGRRVVGVEIT
jgi:hypothetical protein